MEKILEEVGLSKNESITYLKLLKLGESKSGEITKATKIASSKIYEILNKLIERGLVSYKLIGKIKYFKAQNPNQLNLILEDRKEKIKKSENKLNKIIPNLNNLYSKENNSSVEFFEGIKGVRTAHNILFSKTNKNSILKYFFPYEKITKEQNLFYNKLWIDHDDLKLKSKGLATINAKEDPVLKEIAEQGHVKFCKFPLPGTIDILEDTILILSWTDKNPSCVLITSKEIVRHFEKYFDSMWKITN